MQGGPAADPDEVRQHELATISIEHAAIGMAVTGTDGRFQLVNPALCRMLDYDRATLEGMSFAQITHPDDAAAGVAAVADMVAGRTDGFTQHKRYLARDGHVVWIDLTVRPVRDSAGGVSHFVAQMEDVTPVVTAEEALRASLAAEVRQRHRLERLVEGLRALHRLDWTSAERTQLTEAIDLAEELTGSRVGYVHYVNEDQCLIELGAWSTATVQHCAVAHDRHYPIRSAGIWADTFRQRRAVIHNDYPAVPDRQGLPEGHVALTSHLGVPVVVDDRMCLLVGVGNKDGDYEASDVALVQLIGDELWGILTARRERRQERHRLDLLKDVQRTLQVGTFEWDPDTAALRLGPVAQALLGCEDVAEALLPWLRGLLDPSSRDRLDAALHDREHDLDCRSRATGLTVPPCGCG